MNASFDGVRKRLVSDFNALAENPEMTSMQLKVLESMRLSVVGLICMYDPECSDDCNDLSNMKVSQLPEQYEVRLCYACRRDMIELEGN